MSVRGQWKISSTVWNGIVQGTLHGPAVRAFLDAMDRDDSETAVTLAAQAYDVGHAGFADQLDIEGSNYGDILY